MANKLRTESLCIRGGWKPKNGEVLRLQPANKTRSKVPTGHL